MYLNECKIVEWVANNVDPDQMSRSAVPDLGLYCLLRSVSLNTQSKYGNLIKSSPPPPRPHNPKKLSGSAPAYMYHRATKPTKMWFVEPVIVFVHYKV